MNNYQLYRTNPLLSGQIKWNIIVNNDNDKLSISNLQLLPISNNALNIISVKEPLKNSHTSNLVKYFANNVNHIFKDREYLNMDFRNNDPLSSNSYNIDLCPITYNMGCKRILYNRFNKQFEFFCPLWLEKVEKSITFKFNAYIKNSYNNTYTLLSSRILDLELENAYLQNYQKYNYSLTYHQNFLNYLSSYLKYTKIDKGNEDVATLNFDEINNKGVTTLTVHGVKLLKGITTDEDKIKINEFNEVSPLFTTDSKVTNAFSSKSLICSQLFNFNFCFNIEDIISLNVMNLLIDQKVDIKISMDVYVDDILLDKKDFDTEYDYIEKTISYDNKDTNITKYIQNEREKNPNTFNVFETLEDTRKYTLTNSICHWSLIDNNDYIINTFKGFEALSFGYDDDNNITKYYNYHQYVDTPSIENTGDPLLGDFSTSWINTKYINTYDEFNTYIIDTNRKKLNGSFIGNENNMFINRLKYINVPNDIKNKYIIGLVVDNKLILRILKYNNCITIYSGKEGTVSVCIKDDLIMFLTTDIKFLTYYRITSFLGKNLSRFTNGFNVIKVLHKLMHSNLLPAKHVKNNDDNDFNIRYDGKIKPRFIDIPSTLYYKTILDNNENNTVLCKLNTWSYNEVPKVTVNNQIIPVINTDNEYSWFNESKCKILQPYIAFTKCINIDKYITKDYYENCGNEYKFNLEVAIKDLICNELKLIYDIDDNELQYILSLYSSSFTWNFVNNNIHEYEINITLQLR